MSGRATLFIIATALALTFDGARNPAAAQVAPESGLLLGFAGGRTMWIPVEGASMRVAFDAPHLIVPRADGYWFVATATRCGVDIDSSHGGGGIPYTLAFVERYQGLAFARAGDEATIELTEDMDCVDADKKVDSVRKEQLETARDSARQDSSEVEMMAASMEDFSPCIDATSRVTFISPQVVSMEKRYSQTEVCSPGGYATSGSNEVLKLGTKDSILLRPMLTSEVRAKAEKERGSEESCAFDDAPERLDDSWAVHRVKGRWVADIWMDGPNVCRGGTNYELNLPLPHSFTGDGPLPLTIAQLQKEYPQLTDAFASPSGSFVLMRTDSSLFVRRVRNGRLAGTLIQLPNAGFDEIVMVRWATKAETLKWSRELPRQVPPTVKVVLSEGSNQ